MSPLSLKISTLVCYNSIPTEAAKNITNNSSKNYVRSFFPLKKSPPPTFFEKIFDLVANTCCFPTCEMDVIIKLLEDARPVVMTSSLFPSLTRNVDSYS